MSNEWMELRESPRQIPEEEQPQQGELPVQRPLVGSPPEMFGKQRRGQGDGTGCYRRR